MPFTAIPPSLYGLPVSINTAGTGIVIDGLLNDRVGYGLQVDLSMTYSIGPNIIPDGASLVETIEWIDHTGLSLGTTDAISYFPSTEGAQSLEVIVTLSDPLLDFSYTFSQDYSYAVDVLYENIIKFFIPFISEHGILRYSNMDITRTLSYFPKWSSAYKNHFSNSSKILSPIFERVSFHTNDIDEIMASNNTIHKYPSYEYKSKIRKILTINSPDYIATELGHCFNLGENSSMSLDSVQIGAFNRSAADPISIISEEVFSGENKIRLSRPSTVYVKSSQASIQSTEVILIAGIDFRGKHITEEIVLDSALAVESINRYHVILSISGNSNIIEIRNAIEDDISYTDNTLLPKRITNRNGRYFTPLFTVEGKTLGVLNGDSIARNEEYKFLLPFEPDQVVISNLLDVILLKDNKIYSSKMFLDYHDLKQDNSSVNNNEMLWVEDENAVPGTATTLTINTSLLKSEHGSASVRISISNSGNTYYIDSARNVSSIKDSWIDLSKTGDRVSIGLDVQNDDQYIFGLEVSNSAHKFYAMIYQNKLDFSLVDEDVSTIFIHDKKLYFKNIAGDTQTAEPVRLGFTTDGSYSYIQYPFTDMEVIYND